MAPRDILDNAFICSVWEWCLAVSSETNNENWSLWKERDYDWSLEVCSLRYTMDGGPRLGKRPYSVVILLFLGAPYRIYAVHEANTRPEISKAI
jgi:hypothetical protein